MLFLRRLSHRVLLFNKKIEIASAQRPRYFSNAAEATNSNTSRIETEPIPENGKSDNQKLLEIQDLYLRSLADMENLRNRTKREIEAAHQFAIQKFVKDLVPVADVMEMALNPTTQHLQQNSNEASHSLTNSLIEGMKMTLEELRKSFTKHGVTIIDPLHQKFDPNYHLALLEIEQKDLESGTIISVEKKGYLLNGRVVRAASVAISK
jgi:molecular chaperone GrpE